MNSHIKITITHGGRGCRVGGGQSTQRAPEFATMSVLGRGDSMGPGGLRNPCAVGAVRVIRAPLPPWMPFAWGRVVFGRVV